MMEEIRTVHIGPHTVEVEVNPDDFKRPAIVWVAVAAVAAMSLAVDVPMLVTIVLAMVAVCAYIGSKAAGRAAMDLAVRRAAYDALPRYEQSRIIGYKSMG